MSTKLKLMGVDVASIGDAHGKTPGSRALPVQRRAQADLQEDRRVARTASSCWARVLVGDAAEYGTLLQMMLNGIELPERPGVPDPAVERRQGQARRSASTRCPTARRSARATTSPRAQICAAVGAGADDHRRAEGLHQGRRLLRRLRAAGHAGDEGRDEASSGMAVNNHLCEHFPYSRQELYHLVRVGEHQAASATCSRKHGKGLGCDICKPAVASILASCWNEFVLKKEHASLQDTQRLLPRQHPEGRHLLGRAAHAGRRSHARRPDRGRPGREEVRPLHQDHRRPARRPVRRARRAAAARSGKS